MALFPLLPLSLMMVALRLPVPLMLPWVRVTAPVRASTVVLRVAPLVIDTVPVPAAPVLPRARVPPLTLMAPANPLSLPEPRLLPVRVSVPVPCLTKLVLPVMAPAMLLFAASEAMVSVRRLLVAPAIFTAPVPALMAREGDPPFTSTCSFQLLVPRL